MLEHFVSYLYSWSAKVHWKEDTDEDWYEGYCIHLADVRGLAEGMSEEKPRQGEMVFNNAAGSPHTLKIVATHTYPIPDGLYALIGWSFHDSSDVWVIGWQRMDGKFEKLSVFSSADDEQVKLGTLGLEKVKTILC